jgi:hypothetical protein
MKTTLELINKKYEGDINRLLNIEMDSYWVKLYQNCIQIIIDNRLINELDVSTNGNIIVGNTSKIIVPIELLNDWDIDVLDLLREKYESKLTQDCLGIMDSKRTIQKLNMVYQYCTFFKIYDILKFVEATDSCQEFSCEENPEINNHDELIYQKHGVLFFPFIEDVDINKNKISITNKGYGTLSNCNLYISNNVDNIFSKNIEIEKSQTAHVYMDSEFEGKIQNISSNDVIQFTFLYFKFGNEHKFVISKKAGVLKEELIKMGGDNVTKIYKNCGMVFDSCTDLGDNNTFISNSPGTTININRELITNDILKVIDNLDNLDIEDSEKTKMKSYLSQAVSELEKTNGNIDLIKSLIKQSGILLLDTSKLPVLFSTLNNIREYLNL